jgi:hypothetical protein
MKDEKTNNRPIVNLYLDDKDLVILGVTVIVIVALFKITDPTDIITNAMSGLFGIAVGRKGV